MEPQRNKPHAILCGVPDRESNEVRHPQEARDRIEEAAEREITLVERQR